jgi:hypothetical protein
MLPRIARVFTVKTKYTPEDEDVFFDAPGLFDQDYDQVHVSCSFSWDRAKAERLANVWRNVCDDVRLGGPAFGDPGGEFTPGLYLKKGYTITSRGCIRKCEYCLVPQREGKIRELKINDGRWVLDSNLLACSRPHVEAVFDMLERQKERVKLLCGLDTYLVKDWHLERVERIRKKLDFLYLAFDDMDDQESVRETIVKLYDHGLKQSQIWCFVLVGFKDDTPEKAERRCEWVFSEGAIPFASYYRGPEQTTFTRPKEWATLCGNWTSINIIMARMKREGPHYTKRFLRGILPSKGLWTESLEAAS